MISRNSNVIADSVHDLDDVASLRDRADYSPLRPVSSVNQRNIGSELACLVCAKHKASIAEIVIDSAMDIVGVKNDDVFVRDGSI